MSQQRYTCAVTQADVDALWRERRRFEQRNKHMVFIDCLGKATTVRFKYELTARAYALMMRYPPFLWSQYYEKD